MPNKLILDKQDPDIAEALSDCKVGQPKTLELTVIPTRDDDRIFEADVEHIAYAEPTAAESTETSEAETPEEPVPGAAMAKTNRPPTAGY